MINEFFWFVSNIFTMNMIKNSIRLWSCGVQDVQNEKMPIQ